MKEANKRPAVIGDNLLKRSIRIGLLCATLGIASNQLYANQPVLVSDINKSGQAVNGGSSCKVGSNLLFMLSRNGNTYLAKTNGTAQHTAEYAEIPGTAYQMTGFETKAFMRIGLAVWTTDGTAEGTTKVLDCLPTPNPTFTQINGSVYFFAKPDADTAYSLWKTNGVPGDAEIVHTFADGWQLNNTVFFDNKMYFASTTNELWVSDGTPAGTKSLRSFAGLSNIVTYDGQVLISGLDSDTFNIWTTDGTALGTTIALELGPNYAQQSGNHLAVSGNVLFGSTRAGKLFRYTAQDLVSYPNFTSLSNYGILAMTNLYNKLSLHIEYENGVWPGFPPVPKMEQLFLITDGTVTGTRPRTGFDEANKVQIEDRYFFSGHDATFGSEPRIESSNGTVTTLDLTPGSPGSTSYFIGSVGDLAVFMYNGELYTTDGTYGGTFSYTDLKPETFDSSPSHLTPAGDLMYFNVTDDGMGDGGLWRTDGTSLGTTRIASLSGDRLNIAAVQPDGSAYYITDRAGQYKLWKTNGTTAGTEQTDTYNGPISWLGGFGNEGYYHSSHALWKTTGAPGNRTRVVTLAGTAYGAHLHNGNIYFTFQDYYDNSLSLYKTDGTEAGTTVVKTGVTPSRYQSLGNELYFSVISGATEGLYRTDGTPAGTVRLLTDSRIEQLGAHKGSLYFCKLIPGDVSVSLYKTDGTVAGTTLIGSTPPGSGESSTSKMYILNDELYMSPNGYNGDLYKLDETDNTLKHVSITGSTPGNYAVFKNAFFFSQDSPKYGKELFKLQFLAPSAATGWNLFQ